MFAEKANIKILQEYARISAGQYVLEGIPCTSRIRISARAVRRPIAYRIIPSNHVKISNTEILTRKQAAGRLLVSVIRARPSSCAVCVQPTKLTIDEVKSKRANV